MFLISSDQLNPWSFAVYLGMKYYPVIYLGGGFKYFLFSPLLEGMIQFDEHIFPRGWFNHQLDMDYFRSHKIRIPQHEQTQDFHGSCQL